MPVKMKSSGISWVGDIPFKWKISEIRYIFNQVKKINYKNDERNLLSLSYGSIVQRDIESAYGLLPENYNNYNIIESGDIVLRFTDLQNDQKSLRVGLSTQHGMITSAYLTLRLLKDMSAKYFYYLLHTYDVEKVFYSMGAGGVRQALGFEELKQLKILIPPVVEQQAICIHLDDKLTKVNEIIYDLQQQIDILQKYKSSLITETVTKGINKSVPMKNSGIEWIGKIPKHWKILRITKYLESLVDYRGKTPEKVDDGVFLVTARNIKNGIIDYSSSQEYVLANEYDKIMRRGELKIGDMLFTTEAPLGEVANVDRTDFALAQRVIKMRGKATIINNYYMKYWFMSNNFQQFLYTLATGSTALGIKGSKLGLLIMATPPLIEQLKIVTFLDDKCLEIDRIVAEKQRLIETMQQYKKSLIYEYVTGKKRVTILEESNA